MGTGVRDAGAALLEREEELDVLQARIERAAGGSGSVVAILGPAGSGKTSLVGHARRIGEERGVVVLGATGNELEAAIPFAVVRGLYERHLAALPENEREAAAGGAARLGMRAIRVGEPDAPDAASADAGLAAMHGLYWLTANLAQRAPLVVAVDDAHWADAASLRFLAYLAHRVEELPLALIAAARPPEPETHADLLEALLSTPAVERLSPRPLSESAVAAIAAGRLGSDPSAEFAGALHRATGGNPFLAKSLIAALAERGADPSGAGAELDSISPREIAGWAERRLRRLPDAARSLAQAVAVLGGPVELRRAARLAGLDAADAGTAADDLAELEVLEPGRPLRFAHPIVRTALHDSLSPAERATAHDAAARLLAADGEPPETVASHLIQAEPAGDESVVAILREAAATARLRGAPDAGAAYLRRALREPPAAADRAHVLRELGILELMLGDPAGAEHLGEALQAMPSPGLRGQVARELTRALLPAGRFADATAALERAISELGPADRELRLTLEAELATATRLDPGRHGSGMDHLEGFVAELQGETPAERLALASIGFQRALSGGPAADAASLAELAIDRGLLVDEGPDSPALADAHMTLIMAERFERADRSLGEALTDARERGSVVSLAVASAFRALLAQRRGTLLDAEADAGTALEAADEAGWTALHLMALAWLAETLVDRGEVDAASEALAAHRDGEVPDNLMLNFLLFARARLALATADAEAAAADLMELGRRESAAGWSNPARFSWRSQAALALARSGDPGSARELAAEEVGLARAWGTPRAIGVALRSAALVANASADAQAAGLREAVDVLAASGARLEHGRALVDLGAALRRAGQRREAREPLASGMELAHRCGAAALAEHARDELVATGARPRRMVRTGVEALTPSELRVARMAADGMTNREIAQALFVTKRTVEVHLTGAYRKLDISSREELPARIVVKAGHQP